MTDRRDTPPGHHLLIAGTGRSGTSFLVKYFDALGYATHFSRFGDYASWDEAANAGAENLPLPALDPDMPYVVKSPWATELIDQIVADPAITLDAVIIPLRDLASASASRTIVELRDMAEKSDFWTVLDRPWAHRGSAPGGVVFSLHPLDQARILALGLHHLLERVIEADIPVVFLSFPRLVQDAIYLHQKLAPILPHPIPAAEALAAHARIADQAKIRVDRAIADPTIDQLDRVALRREIERLQGEIAALNAKTSLLAAQSKDLADHAHAIETSRMWRAFAPLRHVLHRLRRRGSKPARLPPA
ncbi:hypothetical protein ACOSOMT5_P1604 [Acidiphilium sp. MT5]